MKSNFFDRFVVVVLLLFLPSTVIADYQLARGASPGELYVYGAGGTFPQWVNWLYRSTDNGQTVCLQNDTVLVGRLAEGVDAGELYKACPNGRLYYSDSFGVDFILTKALGTDLQAIASGYVRGEVYAIKYDITKYSSDFGKTFVDKGTCPGWVFCMSVGHGPGEIYCGCHHGEVYYSSNYGETYELVIDLANSINIEYISRGIEPDEIFLFGNNNWLYYSPNRGDTLCKQYFFDTDFVTGITGGFFPGEVYVLESVHYFEGGGDLYIHQSTDYGQTFTTYHVYSAQEDVIPPQAVADLTCASLDSSIFLDWSPITKDIWDRPETIDHYVVYRSQDPYFVPAGDDSIGFANTSSYTDLGARWDTQAYYYVVKAVDESGNKSKSSNKVGTFNVMLNNW